MDELETIPESIVTTDTIMGYLQVKVETKQPITPSLFLDAAMKLNVLLGDEIDKQLQLAQQVSELRITLSQEYESRFGKTNITRATMYVEASEVYKDLKRQEAKIERIQEFIRLAKIQARMRDSEYRLQ